MLRNKKKKNKKPNLPTEEEMLKFKPKREEYEWTTKPDGLVEIKIPKFEGNFGKSFCKIIKKDNFFNVNLDKIGSLVWKHSDGKHTVKEILEILKKKYPDEEDIDQRLFLFVQQIGRLGYLK